MNTYSTNKHLILEILNERRSTHNENLIRATRAFSKCSPEEMKSVYYESGMTRDEIIAGYTESVAKTDELILWFNQITSEVK